MLSACVTILVLGFVVAVIHYGERFKAEAAGTKLNESQPFKQSDLDANIKKLIQKSWGPYRETATDGFALKPAHVAQLKDFEDVVKLFLKHIRQVAPGLYTPFMTPRIVVEPLTDAAGQFVVEDGWVRIVVGHKFFNDRKAALSILCHEICHYILGANSIQEFTTEDNERLTDVAMFVFGFGDIFLEGYHHKPKTKYRPGHRLGYLSDREYTYVSNEVARYAINGHLQTTVTKTLETRFANFVPDPRARQRLLDNAKRLHPAKSLPEHLQILVDSYEWERKY